MVYVNSKKFACESCIKGHRSSSCHHTDRPLFEIKKKGRPVSQCERCRELRQSKRVHSKCTCSPRPDPASRGEVLASTTSKSRRYIPIIPALPNGLRDVLAASHTHTSLPADSRQRVDTLLNPCNCKSVWKCDCRQGQPHADSIAADLVTPVHEVPSHVNASGVALMPAHPNAKIAPPNTFSSPPPSANHKHHVFNVRQINNTRVKHCHNDDQTSCCSPDPVLELPPIQSSSESSPTVNAIPDFGFMPPMSTIASLAGSGCTCGVQCACPGCVEHRGSEYAAKDLNDCCADGQCQTCVDNKSGHALQSSTSPFSSIPAAATSPSAVSSSLDFINKSTSLHRFYERAAALPAPPHRRLGNGIQYDLRDVAYDFEKVPSVNLPKLCCGGRCSCPNNRCGCSNSCGGCCLDTDSSMAIDGSITQEILEPPLESADAAEAPPASDDNPAVPDKNCCCHWL